MIRLTAENVLEAEALPIQNTVETTVLQKDCNDRMSRKACYLNPKMNGSREWPFP